MRSNREKIFFVLYIVGFVILVGTLAFHQPLMDTPPLFTNPPDEHSRYLVPRYICRHGVIPTGLEEELRIPSYGFSYGLYNVFPYIVQGYVMRLVSLFTGDEMVLLYTARSVNVLFGTVMAWLIYRLGRVLFEQDGFRWLFCLGITYFPQNIFIHSYVNTDSCCLLSVSMILYGLVTGYQNGMKMKSCIMLGSGMALCALSYYNAYGYIVSGILLFVAFFVNKKDGRLRWDWIGLRRKGLLAFGIWLLGCGWWFVRSALVLDGDFLGLVTRREMSMLYGSPEVNPLYGCAYYDKGYSVWEMIRAADFFEGAFTTFVASYGSVTIFGGIWLYRAYKIYFGLGSAGVLCRVWRALRKTKYDTDVIVGKGHIRFFHGNMIFCMIMPVLLMLYYAYTVDYQNQGRYLLPALIPLQYYMVCGFRHLAGFRAGKEGFGAGCFPVIALLTGVTAGVLPVVASLYMVFVKALPLYP